MALEKEDHIHTFAKFKGRPGWWRCEAAKCMYIGPAELVRDKATLCNLCHTEMILDREAMRRAKPRCVECSNTKKARTVKAAKALAASVLKGLEDAEDDD